MFQGILRLAASKGTPLDQLETGHPGYSKHWCVFALLYTTVWADGKLVSEEEIEVDALLTRARSLIPIGPDDVVGYVDQFEEILGRDNSVFRLVDLACKYLPTEPGLGEAIFSHCADIVFSDRLVVSEEIEYLNHLADALKVKRNKREAVLRVMRWKHRH